MFYGLLLFYIYIAVRHGYGRIFLVFSLLRNNRRVFTKLGMDVILLVTTSYGVSTQKINKDIFTVVKTFKCQMVAFYVSTYPEGLSESFRHWRTF
jgi:hypothetical protein